MKSYTSLLLGLIVLCSNVLNAEDPIIKLSSDRLVVQVKGIVCSFCAHGVEKNLSRLNFLDKTQFGDNGVLIDINTQQILRI